MLRISKGGITECIREVFLWKGWSQGREASLLNPNHSMQSKSLEWPWKGDNGKYLLNLWRQEVFLSLEATEKVTKIG